MDVLKKLFPAARPSGRITLLLVAATLIIAAGSVLWGTVSKQVIAAEDGQALFDQKCVACHTIGGGRSVGPDLKDVSSKRDANWIIRFITTPDKVIAEGDATAAALVKDFGMQMPNLGVTEAQATAIISYIDSRSSGTSAPPEPTPPQPLLGDAASGRKMFTGEIRLENGGIPCISCHNVNGVGDLGGGTLAKDLTTAYTTLGEATVVSILRTTPFIMMKDIYPTKPLTENEVGSIVLFLKDAGAAPAAAANNASTFFIIGLVSMVALIGIFQLIWRGRVSGVRRSLVKGGSR